jgi:small subunit ribosomal protein S6
MKKPIVKQQISTPRQYECMFIIANTVNEEGRNALTDKFAKMAGADTKVEKWGLKKFMAPIDHKKDGYYVLMNFTALPDVPKKIGDLMRITDGIVRYMFVEAAK